MQQLFEAVNARFLGTDLAAEFTAISAGEAFPSPTRPYVIADPVSEVRSSRTTTGRYTEQNFTLMVIADDFEEGTRLGYLLQDRMLDPPLSFSTAEGRLMHLEDGQVSWNQEDQYWRVSVEFTARVGKPGLPRNYG